jgi:hypothetical protein
MCLDELFERAVSMSKTVWQKRGEKISRAEVKRMVATDVKPRTQLVVKDETDE